MFNRKAWRTLTFWRAARDRAERSAKQVGILALLCVLLGLAGCHAHTSQEYSEGKKAESIEDYDTAVVHYQRALRAEPDNAEYKLKLSRMRFEAGQHHVEEGQKLLKNGDLQLALAEFQMALTIDPSSPIAQQKIQDAINAIASKTVSTIPSPPAPDAEKRKFMSGPPELEPMSRASLNLKMTNDSKIAFEALTKLAGLTVIFDPDFTSRRVALELTNVTVEQALDTLSLEAKAFWKPITNNIIFVAPDLAQKRKDYEEEVVQVIYVKNTILPQELTEIVTGLRQLLDLRRIQQFNSQNAIIIRDTPDRLILARKIIDAMDKPKGEVVIQFAVLQARRDRERDLGIDPGTSVSLTFTPPSTSSSSSSSSSSSTTSTTLALNQLRKLSSSDYSVTLPGATGYALLTDTTTRIIDNPEIRIVDGQEAKLRIGDRVPIATGSTQTGVAVSTSSSVSALTSTQFQYIDVGVLVDVTPRIHIEDNEVSMKLSVEISSVTGTQTIGGISEPVISTKKMEHEVRLKDGEVNILGGLIDRTDSKSVNGWPGLARVPFLRYFTSSNDIKTEDSEVLIVVIPHIIRTPNITADDLRGIASGTDSNPEVRLESVVRSPAAPTASGPAPAPSAAPAPGATEQPASVEQATLPVDTKNSQLRFEPSTVVVKPGAKATIAILVQDAQDLYSIPMLLRYDPRLLSIEDVQAATFLSEGAQPITLVQRIDKERGQVVVSAARMPNTTGVSGSGTLFNVVVRGIAPGVSRISIPQIAAHDSKQQKIQFVASEATVKVEN